MSAFSLPSIFPVANADQVANHQKSVPGGDSSRAMPVGAGTRIFQPALGQQPSETISTGGKSSGFHEIQHVVSVKPFQITSHGMTAYSDGRSFRAESTH